MVVLASAGLARLLPAGPAAAAAWQAGQYRRLDAASGTARRQPRPSAPAPAAEQAAAQAQPVRTDSR